MADSATILPKVSISCYNTDEVRHEILTWKDYIGHDTHINQIVGELSVSISASIEHQTIPWLTADNISIFPEIIDLAANSLGKKALIFEVELNKVLPHIKDCKLNDVILKDGERLKTGADSNILMNMLLESNFTKADKVWNPKEYSVLGDIVVFWPEGFNHPIRAEIEEKCVVRLALIDSVTRRKIEDLKWVDFGHSSTVSDILENVRNEEGGVETFLKGDPKGDFLPFPIFVSSTAPVKDELDFSIKLAHFDFKYAKWQEKSVQEKLKSGWEIIVVTKENHEKADKLTEEYPKIKLLVGELDQGFSSHNAKIEVLTDQELWGTLHFKTGLGTAKGAQILNEINPGDYIVHEDHGVAVYCGLKDLEKDGQTVKYLELKYAGDDKLWVPLSQISKVSKYIGASGRKPVLTGLGGGQWNRIKLRVKKNVQKLAAELLRLYAIRQLAHVEQVKANMSQFQKFENDFEFVETEDQLRAIEEIKRDMQGSRPMDRLLVGDVGFGKTEVAMRAAFLAVDAGFQVAVLAPTTILVEQHYHVFKERFEKYGVKVGVLSRFVSKEEIEKVIEGLRRGTIDIVVGTHRILSGDVWFKNLGLLVVDEEQRFGVAQKEKLKGFRVDVHVLSMSATPIPRTLNMALSGVRDISVIATPPEGRKAIENIVERFSWEKVRDAIKREVDRGGQVYLVHNRVQTIGHIKEKLSEMLSGVRFAVGHGQMPPAQLSAVMREFNEEKYDVLICSTIIENGLDMPNVNTIIIDRAEMFGLAQLYQLRGRVGRGKKQAYAYFFYHGLLAQDKVDTEVLEMMEEDEFVEETLTREDAKGTLWDTARQRLDAITQLKELGSGFGLAQRDLEIRGAGDFLGRDQHGSVSAVGFSLYTRLLAEMIEELRSGKKQQDKSVSIG